MSRREERPVPRTPPRITLPPPDVARRLRAFFDEAGYTEQGFAAAFGAVETPLPYLRGLPKLLHLTARPTVLNALVRSFLIGAPLEADPARSLLPEWFTRACLEHGLLRPEADGLHPTALLAPHGAFLIASDLYERFLSDADYDYVLTVNPAAKHLLDFTVRRPCGATLDLCAGCGIQALAAAAHSERVVATDLNPRAAAFCAFNGRLNGRDNLEVLTGDAFGPVEGRRFDLVVCNPPFILAPERRYLYRDNTMELDQFCRSLVRQAPGYLVPGGLFQMILEWAQVEGETWQERVSEWFEGAESDVWLLKVYTQSPAVYAQTRLRETPYRSPEEDAACYERWMDYYREKKIVAMHGGFIVMRRRAGPGWLRIDEVPEEARRVPGDAILQGFASRDFLQAHASDEALLASRPRLSPGVRLEQEYRCSEGHWRTLALRLSVIGGLAPAVVLEGEVAEFLAGFDGLRTVGALVETAAAQASADPARVREECLGVVRRMVERGFLVP